ncbi:MAG: lysophospholipid acyltransferase family protein [SAR324 cluster bacterium]|nr:lysophospholipid acyltransferase family protein [SAR324 cluster bacterium]
MANSSSLKKRFLYWVAPTLIRWMLLTIGMTCKPIWFGREKLDGLEEKGENWIFSLWHKNVGTANYLLRNYGLVVMVSPSNEGEWVSKVVIKLGNDVERGSSSGGGARALLKMIKRIKAGQMGAITPDGPRGPMYQLEPGAIAFAQKTGRPLVPLHIEYTKPWLLKKTWDQQTLPKFFSKIIITLGDPFYVPEKLTKSEQEQTAKDFQKKMMENVAFCEEQLEQYKLTL